MKILYLEALSGFTGKMMLGSLLEIIGNNDCLLEELKKVDIGEYKIDITKKEINGVYGTFVDIDVENSAITLNDFNLIIQNSALENSSKQLATNIFMKIANAKENDVVCNKEELIEILGVAILIKRIKPEKIVSSVINEGHGINALNSIISQIFINSKVQFKQIDVEGELIDITGAAIIAELVNEYNLLPALITEKIGWGAGDKDIRIPNLLKVYLGEIQNNSQEFVVMETNIDDCSGEIFGYIMEKLFKEGAIDVFFTPIFVKKNRPAYRLTVACKGEDLYRLQKIIFDETTTIGIRYRYETRTELGRKISEINTKYGKLKVKIVNNNGKEYIYPEYEDLKRISEENNVPLKELYKLEELNHIKESNL